MAAANLDLGRAVGEAIKRVRPDLAVIGELIEERARQHTQWGEQNHPDLSPKLVPTRDGVQRFWLRDVMRYYGLPAAADAKALTDDDTENGACSWLAIAVEELAEVAEAAALGDEDAVRAELVQLAAVCVQWVQAIDRRRPAATS